MEAEHIGVCILVLNKDKKSILLGKRINSYNAGTFGLPGGRLEGNESLFKCVQRELFEETDLEAKNAEFIGVVRDFQEHYNFIHFAYICTDYTGNIQQKNPKNVKDGNGIH